ncbi:MAG: hypothetical protein RL757_604 [Bacteroidota bacterium]|jgi:DNA adenine methylase
MTLFLEKTQSRLVKSPLNYIGGKAKLLPQLLPLFPKEINTFVDLFTGGANVGVNVKAQKIYCNDNLSYLIDLYESFKNMSLDSILLHIEHQVAIFELSLTNESGYKAFRNHYNTHRNPLDLFVLIAYTFNHQIRFNNSHAFNNPFGKERSCFNEAMKNNLIRFLLKLQQQNIHFSCNNFEKFDFSELNAQDFVYCDPPYLITTGTYNDGKRGFTGWNEVEEKKLLDLLCVLHEKQIRFALSNVLFHKGKENELLNAWLQQNPHFQVHHLQHNYANANYQTLVKDKNASLEVLITNYEITKDKTLFDE